MYGRDIAMRFDTLASPALVAAAALTVCVFTGSGAAKAQGLAVADSVTPYRLLGPVVRDNLGVYFVRGAATGRSVPMTLDQAVSTGAAKVYDVPNGPPTVENLSNRDLFIQSGDLLTGGLQDQVIASGLVVPPGSGRVPLEVFCVDPFRSTARLGLDSSTFTASGALLPSRMARLSMLGSSAESSKSVRYVRQLGVWWSIDGLRAALSDALGEALEPPAGIERDGEDGPNGRARTLLEARRSASTTGLPLALRNEALRRAQEEYGDVFAQRGDLPGDVVGAVFAINGRIEAAEIYESNGLFRAAWPKLLRAYATAAIAAARQGDQPTVPSIEAAQSFLAGAQPILSGASAQAGPDVAADAAVYSGTLRPDGSFVHRTYLRRFDPAEAANSPEATMLSILASGEVNGRPIENLSSYENIILRSDAGTWQANVVPALDGSSSGFPGALMAGFLPVLFLLIRLAQVICVAVIKQVAPRVRDALVLAARCSANATRTVGRWLRSQARGAAVAIAFILLSAILAVVQACKRLSASLRYRWNGQVVPAATHAWAQRPLR
jgi:hypothetical protein